MFSNDIEVTSPYGMRIHPIKKRRMFHYGVDLVKKGSKYVAALHGGTVVHRGSYSVAIRYKRWFKWRVDRYVHLSPIFVSKGDLVEEGQKIGVWMTSRLLPDCTGRHLHFEQWVYENGWKSIEPSVDSAALV